MNENIMKAMGFEQAVEDKNNCICPFCKQKINPFDDFRDPISYKEWKISGLCQKCQDDFYK